MKLFDFFHKEQFNPPPGGWSSDIEEKVATLTHQNRALKNNLERSLMISHALWEIVRFQCGLTDEDILRKINEIDLRDGVLDSKNQGKPVTCRGCGQSVSTRNPACPYCGEILNSAEFSAD